MDENMKEIKSDLYLGIIGIGCVISIWVSLFIYITYPDIGSGFAIAMLITWAVAFILWGFWAGGYQIVPSDAMVLDAKIRELETEVEHLKSKSEEKGDDEK